MKKPNFNKTKTIPLSDVFDYKPSLFDKIYCFFRRKPGDFWYGIKSYYQLFRYGYKFSDCWSLDYSVAKFLLPRLKHLRNNNMGHPCKLTDKKWREILDQMIWSFDFKAKRWFDESIKFNAKNRKKYKRGIELFAKYFDDLWD